MIKFHLIEYLKGKSGDPFNVTKIDNLKLPEINRKLITCFATSTINNHMAIVFSNTICIIDLDKKELIWSHNIGFPIDKIYSIENTNEFFGLCNSISQLVYMKYNESTKAFDIVTKKTWKALKIELMKNFVAFHIAETQLLVIYNIDQIRSASLVAKDPIFQLKVENFESITFSPDCNYMALLENQTQLSLFRLKDFSKCASVILYSRANAITLSDKFVSIAMVDRRVLSYLIVDPREDTHKIRVDDLPSR